MWKVAGWFTSVWAILWSHWISGFQALMTVTCESDLQQIYHLWTSPQHLSSLISWNVMLIDTEISVNCSDTNWRVTLFGRGGSGQCGIGGITDGFQHKHWATFNQLTKVSQHFPPVGWLHVLNWTVDLLLRLSFTPKSLSFHSKPPFDQPLQSLGTPISRAIALWHLWTCTPVWLSRKTELKVVTQEHTKFSPVSNLQPGSCFWGGIISLLITKEEQSTPMAPADPSKEEQAASPAVDCKPRNSLNPHCWPMSWLQWIRPNPSRCYSSHHWIGDHVKSSANKAAELESQAELLH